MSGRPVDRELLERILSSDELERATEPSSVLANLIDALKVLLGDLLGSQQAVGAARISRVVFFVGVGVIVAWLLSKLLRRLRPAEDRADAASLAPRTLAPPERHLDLADAARGRGELRPAMRHYFLAVLSELEEHRWVGYGRFKTNREYAVDLRERAAPTSLRGPFDALVSTYDRLWYGLVAVDESDVDGIAERCRTLVQDARARRREAA